jgi:hypothetical protein
MRHRRPSERVVIPLNIAPSSFPPSLPPSLPPSSASSFPFLEDPTDFDSKKADALVGAAPWDYCGSCFQARTHTGACCNSCQDLEQAYLTQGLPMGKIK